MNPDEPGDVKGHLGGYYKDSQVLNYPGAVHNAGITDNHVPGPVALSAIDAQIWSYG